MSLPKCFKNTLLVVLSMLCIFGTTVLYNVNNSASAFMQGPQQEGDNFIFCYSPKYKVTQTYKLIPDNGNFNFLNDVPENERVVTNTYYATTNASLCLKTGSDQKVENAGKDDWWFSSPPAWEGAQLRSPSLNTATFNVHVKDTIDCRKGEPCDTSDNTITRAMVQEMINSHQGQSATQVASQFFNDLDAKVGTRHGDDSAGHHYHIDDILAANLGTDKFREAVTKLNRQDDFWVGQHLKVDWSYEYFGDISNNSTTGDDEQDGKVTPQDQVDPNQQPNGTCESGAGTSLGWILCPVLENASHLVKGIYDNFIEPALTINPVLLSTNNGTFSGWEIMRNFANIAFVILLLVVIFSQLTGVGIDNYGIKKILPKLIVAAVLVNLSYFICQLLVDVSNIVGASIKSLLGGISIPASQTSVKAQGVTIGDFTSGIINVGVILAGAVAALGAFFAAGGWIGILPILVLGAISAGIAIFFFFAVLSIRQALVVILVVLSPLAFVCYMLPNTKSLFDKWRKAFQAMLLLFPICGLLIGGGELVSRILIGTGTQDWFILITAMLASIVPMFFIPTILKSSMQALGTLGGKLAGLTSLGKTAGAKIKGSEQFKNRQIDAKAHGLRPGSRANKVLNSRLGRRLGGQTIIADAQNAKFKKDKDAVEAAMSVAKATTGNDADRANTYLAKMVTDANQRIKKGKNLSQYDMNNLHAAMKVATALPANASSAMDEIWGEEGVATDMRTKQAVAKIIANDPEMGKIINTDTPADTRLSSHINAGKPLDSATRQQYVKNEGAGMIQKLKTEDFLKMNPSRIPELADTVTKEQLEGVLNSKEAREKTAATQKQVAACQEIYNKRFGSNSQIPGQMTMDFDNNGNINIQH